MPLAAGGRPLRGQQICPAPIGSPSSEAMLPSYLDGPHRPRTKPPRLARPLLLRVVVAVSAVAGVIAFALLLR